MVCFILYIAANIGLGAQNSYGALMILRCFQSAGSSGTVALANAVAADTVTAAERGIYISWAATVPMFAPTLGPIIGGVLAQYANWHWIFWFLLILAGVVAVPMAIFYPETCRKIVGDGSIPPPKWNKCYTNVLRERKALREGENVPYDKRDELVKTRRVRFPNPLGTIVLLLQRECGYALLYSGILSSTFYVTLALVPSQFATIYHFNELQIALCYIPFGVGSLVAAFNRGKMIDTNFRRHAKRLGIPYEKNRETDLTNFPVERARLEVAIPTILLGSACTIGFGWMLYSHVSLAGPLIMLLVLGFCLSTSLNSIAVLMVDIYPGKAGTVNASNNLLRCSLGAGATAAIVPMIDSWGVGWSVTFFGILNLVTTPLLWYVMRQGPKWRAEVRQKKLEKEAKAKGNGGGVADGAV